VFTKQLFGGIGQNFANPAIVARIVLFLSFASQMTTYAAPGAWRNTADAISAATPLQEGAVLPSLWKMLIGQRGGCLGETCALTLLIGGLYLVVRRVISPLVPLCYIGSTTLLCWSFGADPLYSMLSGGLLLGAIFMATDYATTPVTKTGKVIFALGCGLITAVIRSFGAYAEGVSFAILLMNILTPMIDRYVRPRPFGV
ncbi:MAG: RnfABCDGE type electron transport complex subunit D, partial [Clostridia bacterium]|nr:RnfABCDGE type electron transport complex subunit D [Clostridia bacterium]